MKTSKFSDARIGKILGEVSSGKSVREVCSSHGVSEGTFYVWKRKYAGMENEALKILLAERDLEVSAVRKLFRKNGWSLPGEPRERNS